MTRCPQQSAEDCLRLQKCPGCLYSLTGLPAEGRCPECGRAYDQRSVVLHGWARGELASLHNASGSTFWGRLLLMLGWMLLLWHLYSAERISPWFLSVGVMFLISFYWLVIRVLFGAPTTVQVHVTPVGCKQFDNVSIRQSDFSVDVVPWSKVGGIELNSSGSERYRIRIHSRVRWWELTEYYVDADVLCTREQAEALRSRVEHWRTLSEQ